jgi:hypothetical protein
MTKPLQGALATPRILQPTTTPTGETLTVHDAIIQAIKAGASHRTAATWAGIHPTTLTGWLTRGAHTWQQQEKQAETIENPDTPNTTTNTQPPDTELPYLNLAQAVGQAEAYAEMRLITSIHGAATDDWRAGQAALAARDRGSWAPTPRVEVTGLGGGPVAHGVAVLSEGEFARKMVELEQRRAAALEAALPVGEVAAG